MRQKTEFYTYLTLALFFVIGSLAACANLGVPTPGTLNEKIAVGLTTVAAIRVSATNLLTAKMITVADAENVQQAASTARTGLDVARVIGETQPTAADNKLTAIMTGLKALQVYLASRGGT